MKQFTYQTPIIPAFFPTVDGIAPPHVTLIVQWQDGDEIRAYIEAATAYDAAARRVGVDLISAEMTAADERRAAARRAVAS